MWTIFRHCGPYHPGSWHRARHGANADCLPTLWPVSPRVMVHRSQDDDALPEPSREPSEQVGRGSQPQRPVESPYCSCKPTRVPAARLPEELVMHIMEKCGW